MLVFDSNRRWGCWKTTTTLENEHECLFSMAAEGGGAGRQPPPSKMSMSAHFQRWWCWCRCRLYSAEFASKMLQVSVIALHIGSCSCSCCCCHPGWQPQLQLLSSSILPGIHVEPSLSCHVTVSKRRKNRNHGRTFARCPHHPLLCRGLLPYPHCSLWSCG